MGYEIGGPGDLISPLEVEDWGTDAPRRIMEIDRDAILSCDAVVAMLDGVQVDDGALPVWTNKEDGRVIVTPYWWASSSGPLSIRRAGGTG